MQCIGLWLVSYNFEEEVCPFYLSSLAGTNLGGGLGPGPPRSNFFLVILYFIFVVEPPFSPISLVSLIQIEIIQSKNFTKTIKILTIVIVF